MLQQLGYRLKISIEFKNKHTVSGEKKNVSFLIKTTLYLISCMTYKTAVRTKEWYDRAHMQTHLAQEPL